MESQWFWMIRVQVDSFQNIISEVQQILKTELPSQARRSKKRFMLLHQGNIKFRHVFLNKTAGCANKFSWKHTHLVCQFVAKWEIDEKWFKIDSRWKAKATDRWVRVRPQYWKFIIYNILVQMKS